MGRLIEVVFSVYSLGLVVYSVLSWTKSPATNNVRGSLAQVYEPVLAKIRTSLPPQKIGTTLVDLSPAVLLIGLMVLRELVLHLLPRGW